MKIKELCKKILDPHHYSSDAYIKYLRKCGVHIGEKSVIYAPRHTSIDVQKPHLITIGDYCKITRGVTILAHDYAISVLLRVFGEFVCRSAPVSIGNNCFLGMNSIILMGSVIGNNCIVGAGSVVCGGEFPDGSIIAGNPAKVISNISKYHARNKECWISDAKRCALEIYKNIGRKPTIEEMRDGFFWLYTKHTKENLQKYESFFKLSGDDYEDICHAYLTTEPIYQSFEAFLDDCGIT